MFLTFMAILNSCTALVEWCVLLAAPRWAGGGVPTLALTPLCSQVAVRGADRRYGAASQPYFHSWPSAHRNNPFAQPAFAGQAIRLLLYLSRGLPVVVPDNGVRPRPSNPLARHRPCVTTTRGGVQEWLSWLLSPLLSSTRPMDHMALSWTTPQEDELGTCQLSGGVSPYMPLMFMRDEARFRPLFALADDAPAAARAEWERCFLLFLRKVTLRCGGGKPLIIKSPGALLRLSAATFCPALFAPAALPLSLRLLT
jgi:hypothetical protein